jgi:hypothetical protein
MTRSDDHQDLTTRGMLMDDDFPTPALHSLTRPQETPPMDADEFDTQFALMDDRDRAAHLEQGANIVGQGAREPQEIRETPPD